MAFGTMAAIALALGAAGAGYSISQSTKSSPKPQALPQAPKLEDSQKAALEDVARKRKAAARSKSIYTNPLGISGEASTAKKMLLGE
jgi:hypothetical protein